MVRPKGKRWLARGKGAGMLYRGAYVGERGIAEGGYKIWGNVGLGGRQDGVGTRCWQAQHVCGLYVELAVCMLNCVGQLLAG